MGFPLFGMNESNLYFFLVVQSMQQLAVVSCINRQGGAVVVDSCWRISIDCWEVFLIDIIVSV